MPSSRWATVVAACLLLVGGTGPAIAQPHTDDVIGRALALIGTPYRHGGASPETGFDCSGLVRYVFGTAAKIALPRRSEEMASVGEPVSRHDLRPGDLVFFNTLRRANSHVAIYLGEDRFVHAPTHGGRVRTESMADRYWRARFDGARRLPVSAAQPVWQRPEMDEPIRP